MNFTPEKIHRILIFRALQLGDMLCAIPAIRALRAAFPDAAITLAGLPWAESLVGRFPRYFDQLIRFPGYPGLPEQPPDPPAFVSFLHHVQQQEFDLALQMQGNGSIVNPMVELFGARYTAGFYNAGHYHPDNGLFLAYPDEGHETERHIKLMEHLGIPSKGNYLEFPLTDADKQDFASVNRHFNLRPKEYVCVHPGSRGAWRQWPPAHFAAIADYFAAQGFTTVLTGIKEELPVVNEVAKSMHHQPVIAAGKTSMGAAGVLLENAFALVSNCTGVSHMAAAFNTPSLIISMDGEPERWAPSDRSHHFVIDWTKTPDFELAMNEARRLHLSHADQRLV